MTTETVSPEQHTDQEKVIDPRQRFIESLPEYSHDQLGRAFVELTQTSASHAGKRGLRPNSEIDKETVDNYTAIHRAMAREIKDRPDFEYQLFDRTVTAANAEKFVDDNRRMAGIKAERSVRLPGTSALLGASTLAAAGTMLMGRTTNSSGRWTSIKQIWSRRPRFHKTEYVDDSSLVFGEGVHEDQARVVKDNAILEREPVIVDERGSVRLNRDNELVVDDVEPDRQDEDVHPLPSSEDQNYGDPRGRRWRRVSPTGVWIAGSNRVRSGAGSVAVKYKEASGRNRGLALAGVIGGVVVGALAYKYLVHDLDPTNHIGFLKNNDPTVPRVDTKGLDLIPWVDGDGVSGPKDGWQQFFGHGHAKHSGMTEVGRGDGGGGVLDQTAPLLPNPPAEILAGSGPQEIVSGNGLENIIHNLGHQVDGHHFTGSNAHHVYDRVQDQLTADSLHRVGSDNSGLYRMPNGDWGIRGTGQYELAEHARQLIIDAIKAEKVAA